MEASIIRASFRFWGMLLEVGGLEGGGSTNYSVYLPVKGTRQGAEV